MSAAENKAVFLSYASQDAEAARRICEALRAAGVEVWFDQSELRGGDAWDAKIRKQIKECALLVPVISANTQARREGYFRLEWKLADDRTHLMAKGTPFLLPVCVDDTKDWDALVPDSFMVVQWVRLPSGEASPTFCARVKALLDRSMLEPGRPRPAERGADAASPSGKSSKSRVWIAAAVAVGVVLAFWQPWKNREPTTTARSELPAASVPLTDAQKLVAQARRVYDEGDELNRENLFLAEDLVKRAQALDPAEPSAWELSAWLSYVMVWHQIDWSDARRDTLRRQAARACSLAPTSVSAQLVALNARMVGGWGASAAREQRDLPDIERELVALAARAPANWQVQRSLGMVYRFQGRADESIAALRRAVELSDGNPSAHSDLANVLERSKRLDESEAVIAAGLARKPTGRLLAQDVFTRNRWRGDLAGARHALESWPGWLFHDDRGLFVAWQTYYWSRQPDKALAVVQRLPRDYLRDAFFAGPRAVLTARAHEMAGHTEAAQADWRMVVQVADRELAQTRQEPAALYWQAWALARLGETQRARALCTLLLQRAESVPSYFFKGTNLAPLLLTAGLIEPALADVRTQITSFNDTNAVTRAVLELDPAYDPVRADPRFQSLVTSAPAPRKAAGTAASAAERAEKSIAVLAFENRSSEKDSEYFSDGISDELINVLGRVPGLRVVGRTSSYSFKDKRAPSHEIGRTLGVTHLIEGSVQRVGGKARVIARLIRAETGERVWGESFEPDVKDVFSAQIDVAQAIARALSLELGVTSAQGGRTVNPQALELYLQGRQQWGLRPRPRSTGPSRCSSRRYVSRPGWRRREWGSRTCGWLDTPANTCWVRRSGWEILRSGTPPKLRALAARPRPRWRRIRHWPRHTRASVWRGPMHGTLPAPYEPFTARSNSTPTTRRRTSGLVAPTCAMDG